MPERLQIKPLAADVISQIAAGEVIDRPAAVVKELIENAVDAGATKITIDLLDSGLTLIRVIDNGHGISRADLPLSVQRHTTSKISTLADLDMLTTLGFRGEALASLAAIGRLEIASRPLKADRGYLLTLDPSLAQNKPPIPYGMAPGTQVSVHHVLSAIPARRKFLKTPTTEYRHILKAITFQALAHPEIQFRVTHNQELVWHLPATTSLAERATELLDSELVTQLISIHSEQPLLKISGLIGPATLTRRTPDHQYWLINGRPVTTPILTQALKAAYHRQIDPRHHPVAVLNLTLHPAEIDPNTHPRKLEVAFRDPTQVQAAVTAAVTELLSPPSTTYPSLTTPQPWKLSDSRPQATNLNTWLKSQTPAWEPTLTRGHWEVLQAQDLYLVTPTEKGLLLIDQHAAHERILYEQYHQTFLDHQEQLPTRQLDEPLTLSLSLPEQLALQEHHSVLAPLGITVEPFGPTTVRITSIPALLPPTQALEIIRQVIDDVLADQPVAEVHDLIHQTLAYLACRTAIKAGDALSHTERQQLIQQLAQTPHAATCPHGRPTSHTVSWSAVAAFFKRAATSPRT